MGHTPPEFRAPTTLTSAHALPSEERALRDIPAYRPRRSWVPASLRRASENRWTPAAITALIGVLVPLAVVWLTRASDDIARQARDTAQEVAQQKAELETAKADVEALRLKLGALRDDLGKATHDAEQRTNWEDVAWCAVGVKSPSGCAEIELLPRPMRGSSAPPIQVRARAPPD